MFHLNKIMLFITTIIILNTSVYSSVLDQSREWTGLYLKDLDICHQQEWRHMSIGLEFQSNSKDSTLSIDSVKHFLEVFLKKYENDSDFWEIMNSKLVHAFITEFPQVAQLKSSINLKPDKVLFYPRQSTIIYSKDEIFLKEFFEFTKLKYSICNESFNELDLNVKFQFQPNPQQLDYPDYRWVDSAIVEFFKEHPISFSNWKELQLELEAYMLIKFPVFSRIEFNITKIE